MKANIFSKKVFFIIVLLNTFFIQAQSKASDKSKEVKLGVYIDNIYNIDYLNSSYEIIFYLWANSYDKHYPVSNVDIDKSIEVEKRIIEIDSFQTKNGKKFNCLVKYKAKILNQMDISKYPFDKLNLNLYIELLGHYKGEKNIIVDTKNSIIKPMFIDKWNIDKTDCNIKSTNWPSNFGDVSHAANSQLEALTLDFKLSRNSWNLYWKMFLVLFISLFLASLNFFLPNKRSEEKFALIVGSLFTAIGNKYITESYLPFSDKINLCDNLHIITFIFISFYALYAIYEQRVNKKDSLKHDLKLFLVTIFTYFTLVLIITYHFV